MGRTERWALGLHTRNGRTVAVAGALAGHGLARSVVAFPATASCPQHCAVSNLPGLLAAGEGGEEDDRLLQPRKHRLPHDKHCGRHRQILRRRLGDLPILGEVDLGQRHFWFELPGNAPIKDDSAPFARACT